MSVEDVFPPRRAGSAPRRGRLVMAAGRIERGRVRRGDLVEIVGLEADPTAVVVAGIEHCHVPVAEAGADMNVGVVLPGTVPAALALERGQVLATPGSISARAGFTADIDVLSEEHGGTGIRSGDRLQFHVRSATVLGTVALPEGTDVIRPLHRAEAVVTLERAVALEEGRSFVFRCRGRATGSGTVTRLAP
ncbi:EF-Tu/IF-2/RF-3 family GTPase [Streptomyces populi]